MTLKLIHIWTENGLEYTFAFLVSLEEVDSLDDQGIYFEFVPGNLADVPEELPV